MPRVSVIIAARDAEEHLQETLESVFAQEFGDWEVVLVDDASADGTGAVARSFGERVRVLENESATGPSAARNAGFDAAEGELVATLDADDLWAPDYLAEQVGILDRAVAKGRRVGVVCCNARLLEGNDFAEDTFADRTAWPSAEAITLHELLRVNLVYTSVVMPRAAVLELGGYACDLRRAEDYDLWLRAAESGYEILWNAHPLATYRVRPGSLTAATEQAMASTAEVYGRALERGRLDRAGRAIARRRRRFYRLLALRARWASSAS